jgi:hypothetical protein
MVTDAGRIAALFSPEILVSFEANIRGDFKGTEFCLHGESGN